MPIEFKNTRYLADGSSGEIMAIAEWMVWSCVKGKWLEGKTTLRNILLAAMYPGKEFCIGEIPPETKNALLLNPFKPEGHENPFFLDLASGSRTHGRFTFTNKSTVGKFYYGADWKRIIYGSIVHTGCKKLIYLEMKYIITDDENKDDNGNKLDDPTNNKNWDTGDSHAKASKKLMQMLGLPADPDGDNQYVDEGKPLQLRVALFQQWVGKGTLAYNPDLDGSGYDIAIPWSSLKGNKPPLGSYAGKLLFGLVFEAEQRRAKPGWMLLQWFSFEVLEKDGIITKLMEKCDRLSQAYDSIVNLAEILRIDQSEAEAELEESSGELQSEAEYENNMIRVVRVDKNGLLLLHPYIVKRVKERLRASWLNLAKAAGIRFYSVMTQPDESLAHYHTVMPDGSIQGQKVFCAPDFEEGEYIVFCNPMRHWGDCQLWENKHEGTYANSTGIMAVPTKLALTLGRDFDGDFVQLIKSSAYPNMRNAIANFSQPPATKKFPKMALQGDLQQIAINSMSDMTGIVASLLARAKAANAEGQVLLIPAGGEQKTDEEMTVIDFLSQQVQIAVDSLKSAYPNNVNGLNAVRKFLDAVEAEAPWLKDFKNPQCYLSRKCFVGQNALDTISRLVKLVNEYWNAPVLAEGDLKGYENVLFSKVDVSEFQIKYATEHRAAYRAAMGEAIAWKNANDGSTMMIREVAQATKNSKEKIFAQADLNGNTYDFRSWVAAYWRVAHRAESGDAGLAFMIFGDEIVAELKNIPETETQVLMIYAVDKFKWSAGNWKGQEVQVKGVIQVYNGKNFFSLEMKWAGAKTQTGWELLGNISEKYKPYFLPGQIKTMKIYSIAFNAQKQTKRVVLFNKDMAEKDIKEALLFDFNIK
ncbi:hypothetical protein [Nodularia spumigena]|uniref:hypothetical protein n=1 Tax=Nodularia spumigena TaxID=70799 RepID=UPI00232C4209|nr:hypothetical protein [Nodularia spumigena]MDB9318201.1 hypothetical protein [Nodularia spumigena CS-590/01A]MDB9328026.1 hypothetical protein [Nodularia spumigena CS-590/02]MDB9334311.1 hypothetical protein [Nodularia spumigena CS-590/01]